MTRSQIIRTLMLDIIDRSGFEFNSYQLYCIFYGKNIDYNHISHVLTTIINNSKGVSYHGSVALYWCAGRISSQWNDKSYTHDAIKRFYECIKEEDFFYKMWRSSE